MQAQAVRKSINYSNNINEVFEYCQNYKEPIFVTNNGQGRYAVMTEDTYDQLLGKLELYHAVEIALKRMENGEVIHEEEMIKFIKNL
ncbi:MAG: antitoxin PHD [Treponema sp.]|jgi:PHD/YefM family antitoxin component YafN of YafNO toxin-antitoxin module|nr:antitoxin PHD [Treponema sp.]